MSSILGPMLVLGGLGFIFAIGLSLASRVFSVTIDPKVEEVRKALPGVNCGACGFPGCDGLAESIAKGGSPVNACPVGGKSVADNLGKIMGLDGAESVREVAVVLCQGDRGKSKEKYEYDGIQDCRAQNILAGGSKQCYQGCLGCGTCEDACDFDAIDIVNGVAIVDKKKCVACKACIGVCPKNLIELVPYEKEFVIKCKSLSPAREVRSTCSIGCIGCQICVKNCPVDAISFSDNLAKIDYEKCINCGICAGKCPTGAIYSSLEKKAK